MATYFISDAHLGLGPRDVERKKEDRLLAFLRTSKADAEGLFILGDLFDLWFEYRTVIPRGYHRTLCALQEWTAAGIPVHYLAGNHDCWMLDFFPEELGVRTYTGPFDTTVDGRKVHLHHGDGLATHDLGYRLIRPLLRSRISTGLYRLLHPDIAIRIARGSSRSSREYTSTKDFGEDEGMVAYAEEAVARGVDIVVMGHRHRPLLKKLGAGLYVNLGDWITYNSYGRLQNGEMALLTWNGT
jgi:UDP-2,3-diacylglucosamine hydrolase